MNKRPVVGVGVILYKDKKILLGKRKNAHGENTWAPPGGHLEFGESIEACAQREVFEETGISIDQSKILAVTNNIHDKEDKHYVVIFVTASAENQKPMLKEPEKCEGWFWFSCDNLPQPLFLSLQNLLKTHTL